MEEYKRNLEAVCTIGSLVELLYEEVSVLPISDEAKGALVTVMMGDILKRQGKTIYFNYPADLKDFAEAAAQAS